jgi:predicted transposase YdaD
LFAYLNQHKVARPWRGLLILQSRSQKLGSVVPYQLLFNAWVERLYLEDLLPLRNLAPNLAMLRLLVIPDRDAGAAAQAILADTDSEAEFRRRLDLVEAILVNKFPLLTIEAVRQMLNLREASVRETRFFQEVLQEGRQEGETDLVLRQIVRRCGELAIEQATQIRSLPIAQLENLGEALLDFGGMADLVDWLRVNVGE